MHKYLSLSSFLCQPRKTPRMERLFEMKTSFYIVIGTSTCPQQQHKRTEEKEEFFLLKVPSPSFCVVRISRLTSRLSLSLSLYSTRIYYSSEFNNREEMTTTTLTRTSSFSAAAAAAAAAQQQRERLVLVVPRAGEERFRPAEED